ncbi:hypothetical protein [Streptomyces sp. NPDC060035]|uniref:hypothetical protein n=1 Tax=Streptomyces sp. NPDC060035 TaxID=3347044 RepID=UPI0036B4488C
MKPVRTWLVLLFLVLACWGLGQTLLGIGDGGLAREVECAGTNLGWDGEETPSPMGPEDRCHLESNDEYRTYEEQRDVQRAARRSVATGTRPLGAGLLGLSVLLLPQRLRGMAAKLKHRA